MTQSGQLAYAKTLQKIIKSSRPMAARVNNFILAMVSECKH
jgi:hypothetical protein